MYTIIINDDNTMYASKKERIIQGSANVDALLFIVDPVYSDIDFTDATLILEYVLPISREYKTESLKLLDERYEDYFLQYKLPINGSLTKQAGEIEIRLTFVKTELDADGNSNQRVRKISPTTVKIIPVSEWCNVIPDDALSALDKEIVKIDSRIRALDEFNQLLMNEKADNIKYDKNSNELQLLANGNVIGDKVVIGNNNPNPMN